ncbi:MAG: hypothetical protein ACXWCY_30160 [Burkholderiales bacterium]
MSLFHGVVLIDHQSAQILQFDPDHTRAQKVKAHTHYTRQHGSGVRTEHEFFGEVCDALTGIAELLVTGPIPRRPTFATTSRRIVPRQQGASSAGKPWTIPRKASCSRSRGNSSTSTTAWPARRYLCE